MKVLVTGSNGRIGANLVKRLLAAGHDIRGFVWPGDASRAHKLDGFDRVELHEGDLRDADTVCRAVQDVDAIVHLAAAFGGPYNNVQYLEVNGLGTIHLLEAVRNHATDLKRFVYACTEAIYWKLEEDGRLFEDPIKESDVSLSHRMPYFLTKWIGEELLMNYHIQYGIPGVSCRFATVFEPSEFLDDHGVPKFCSLAAGIERFESIKESDRQQSEMLETLKAAWDDGARLLISRCPDGRSYKQEWADVRDIAKGLALSVVTEAAVGETFTLGGLLTAWEDVVPQLAERLDVGYTEATLPVPNHFEFDHTKVNEILGYTPDHDLWSTLDAALAIRAGQETEVIPTGIRYGAA